MEAELAQPTAAPDPMTGNGINDQGDSGGVNAIGAELGTLCHSAGNNGGRGGAEHGLENCKGPQRNAAGKNMAVILHNHRVDPAEQLCSRSEHNAETNKPETGRTDAEVHQVFHQNIAGVLGSGKSGLTHGKTCLHKEHQGGTEQHPNRVHRTECHGKFLLSICPKGRKRIT